jgi:hypothetical protein
MFKFLIVSALILASQFSFARTMGGRATFMPENRLNSFDNVKRIANITEADFNRIVDSVIELYKPVVAGFGAKLVSEKKWNDSTVNAYAQQNGNVWSVTMFGGLARRPEVTQDGFALVVCHELGHHLAGYAFYDGDWAAAEGQSDYFSTQFCARALWGMQQSVNRAWYHGVRSNSIAIAKCNDTWPDENSRGWCYRASAAGQSLATLLASLGGEKLPTFETPDASVVSETNANHPRGQCRLDTYFAGALCKMNFNSRLIPGKTGGVGNNDLAAEMESAKYTCFKEDGFAAGYRPACWFHSLRDGRTPPNKSLPPTRKL